LQHDNNLAAILSHLAFYVFVSGLKKHSEGYFEHL